MKILEIWRYPVKTMAGERLSRARLGALGIEGDRIVRVENAEQRVITSRTHPRFLGHKGTLGNNGEPLVDGRPWNDPTVAANVREIAGPGARLVRYEGADRFDILSLLTRPTARSPRSATIAAGFGLTLSSAVWTVWGSANGPAPSSASARC